MVEALEPAGTGPYVTSGSELAAARSGTSSDGVTLPEPSAYAAPGQTVAPSGTQTTTAATGTQAAAAVAARAPGALLSTDQAAATRNQLLDMARTRGTPAGGASSTTAADLLRLRETHGADAIAEIEAAAADD